MTGIKYYLFALFLAGILGEEKWTQSGEAEMTMAMRRFGICGPRAWPETLIVPLHFEGWEHFSEGRTEIGEALANAGLQTRLRWLEPGRAQILSNE